MSRIYSTTLLSWNVHHIYILILKLRQNSKMDKYRSNDIGIDQRYNLEMVQFEESDSKI